MGRMSRPYGEKPDGEGAHIMSDYGIDRENGYALYHPDKWEADLYADDPTLFAWLERIGVDRVHELAELGWDWRVTAHGSVSGTYDVRAEIALYADEAEEGCYALELTDEEQAFIAEDMRELLEEDGVIDGHGGITGGEWL